MKRNPIEQYIKTELIDCPLTEDQEQKLLIALDRYISEELKIPNQSDKPGKIKIDENIPIPVGVWKKKYPYDKMKVGDSYWCEDMNGCNCALNWAQRTNNGMKFTRRKENEGFRIWRIK